MIEPLCIAGATCASELYDLATNEAPRFQKLDENRQPLVQERTHPAPQVTHRKGACL